MWIVIYHLKIFNKNLNFNIKIKCFQFRERQNWFILTKLGLNWTKIMNIGTKLNIKH